MADKKSRKIICFCMILVFFLLLVSLANATDIRYYIQEKLAHGHVLYIKDVSTDPYPISAGSPAKLKFKIKNTGESTIKDIRLTLSLPIQFTTFNDISKIKLAQLGTGESIDIEFNIMALPDAEEGVYISSIYSEYINPVGTDISENVSIGLSLGGVPQIFLEIGSSEVYKGNNIGEITIKFVNNDVSNIKFLTVELEESEDFEILSASREYIGDLDSDDFETADFRIKVTARKDQIELPLSVTYKDSLNREYNKKLNVFLPMRTAAELGIGSDNTLLIFIIIAIVIIIAYIIFKRYKRMKKKKNAKRLH